MPRDFRVYLEDILGAISKIRRYTNGLSTQALAADEKTLDAVVRNLEVIGEAVKQLPPELRALEPSVDWQKVAIIWDVIRNKLPALEASVTVMLSAGPA
jgi:uncharacterized protein with HEPN domain